MPRIKLRPLAAYSFESTHQVRVTDVNYGGHLANHALAGLLHQARLELLSALGLSEMDLGDGHTGLIMIDIVISFAAEGFMQDKLTILSAFTEVKRGTFRLCHEVRRGGDRLALAETGFAGYDYSAHKLAPLPPAFTAKARAAAGEPSG